MIIDFHTWQPKDYQEPDNFVTNLSDKEEKSSEQIEEIWLSIGGYYAAESQQQELVNLDLYAQAIEMITNKALDSQSLTLVFCANYYLNNLQCTFVAPTHMQRLSFVFNTAHKKIDEFINVFPDTEKNLGLKAIIDVSNYEREEFLKNLNHITGQTDKNKKNECKIISLKR